MRVLWATTCTTDYPAACRYIQARFNPRDIDIDILAHAPRILKQKEHVPTLIDALGKASQKLLERQGFRSVRTRPYDGKVFEAILQASRQFRSNILLMDAPEKRGLLTAFGGNSVSRRLVKHTQCSVEFIRESQLLQADEFEVAVPIPVERIWEFPFGKLAAMGWKAGTRIRLIAVIAPAMPDHLVEASPAAVLRAQQSADNKMRYAEGKMSAACLELAEEVDKEIDIDFNIVMGGTAEVITAIENRSRASLILMSSPANDHAAPVSTSTLSPAAMAMSSRCSFLMLRDAATGTTSPARPRRLCGITL